MSLTPRQKFKIAFLKKCAQDGLTMEQAHQRVLYCIDNFEKQADITRWPGQIAGAAMSGGARVIASVPQALQALTMTGIAVPAIGGTAAGYLAAKTLDPENRDAVEDAKRFELINEYERLTAAAKQHTEAKQLQDDIDERLEMSR